MMQLLLITMLLQGDVTVTLPMEAHVRGTEVELGEIAEISGADTSVVASLRALELGYAPAPGYSRLFAARKIQEILSRKAPRVRVCFAGQPACRVYPEVTEISGTEIATAAKAASTTAPTSPPSWSGAIAPSWSASIAMTARIGTR